MTNESAQEPLQAIQALVEHIGGAREVTPATRLFQDLGIAGDDAWELLEEVVAKFAVSFEGFDFVSYFPEEDEAFGAHLLRLVGRITRKKSLTVGHLAEVVRAGAWFDPQE